MATSDTASALEGQELPAALQPVARAICDSILDGTFSADALDSFFALEGAAALCNALFSELFRLFAFGSAFRTSTMAECLDLLNRWSQNPNDAALPLSPISLTALLSCLQHLTRRFDADPPHFIHGVLLIALHAPEISVVQVSLAVSGGLVRRSAKLARLLVGAFMTTENRRLADVLRKNEQPDLVPWIFERAASHPHGVLLLLMHVLPHCRVSHRAALGMLLDSFEGAQDTGVLLQTAYVLCLLLPHVVPAVVDDLALQQRVFALFLRVLAADPGEPGLRALRRCQERLFTLLYGLFPGPLLMHLRDLKGIEGLVRARCEPLFARVRLHAALMQPATAVWQRLRALPPSVLLAECEALRGQPLFCIAPHASHVSALHDPDSARRLMRRRHSLPYTTEDTVRAASAAQHPSTSAGHGAGGGGDGREMVAESGQAAGGRTSSAITGARPSAPADAETETETETERAALAAPASEMQGGQNRSGNTYSGTSSGGGTSSLHTRGGDLAAVEQQLAALYGDVLAVRESKGDLRRTLALLQVQLLYEEHLRSRLTEALSFLFTASSSAPVSHATSSSTSSSSAPPSALPTSPASPSPRSSSPTMERARAQWQTERAVYKQRLQEMQEENQRLRNAMAEHACDSKKAAEVEELKRNLDVALARLALRDSVGELQRSDMERREAADARVAQLVTAMLQWEREQPLRADVAQVLQRAAAALAGAEQREQRCAVEVREAQEAAAKAKSQLQHAHAVLAEQATVIRELQSTVEQLKMYEGRVEIATRAQLRAVESKYASVKAINVLLEQQILDLAVANGDTDLVAAATATQSSLSLDQPL